MLRPLAISAGATWALFAACLLWNAVAIRSGPPLFRPDPPVPTHYSPRLAEAGPRAPAPTSEDPLQASIRTSATENARELLADPSSGLGELSLSPVAPRVDFVLASARRGIWVTQTELRVPCAALDAALSSGSARRLGRPVHCERWVEATAAAFETRGLTSPTPREFLQANAAEQTVRVLVVFAGWRRASEDGEVELVDARPAPVLPRSGFARARRRARLHVYQTLELGPYAADGG